MSKIISLERAIAERVTRTSILSAAAWHDTAQKHDRARREEHARIGRELRNLASQLPASYLQVA